MPWELVRQPGGGVSRVPPVDDPHKSTLYNSHNATLYRRPLIHRDNHSNIPPTNAPVYKTWPPIEPCAGADYRSLRPKALKIITDEQRATSPWNPGAEWVFHQVCDARIHLPVPGYGGHRVGLGPADSRTPVSPVRSGWDSSSYARWVGGFRTLFSAVKKRWRP